MQLLAIFDLDGTLFRTETATLPAVRLAFEECSLPPPEPAAILPFFGRPAPEFHAWLAAHCPPGKAAALAARVDELELECVAQTGQLYPGAAEALAEVRAGGAQTALCSNGDPAYVAQVLGIHRLAPLFDRVRCRLSPGDTKPGMVAEILGALPARPAVVVGDRDDDVAAAHANGLVAIAATYGYGTASELAGADAFARAPAELPALLMGAVPRQLPTGSAATRTGWPTPGTPRW